MMEDLVKGVLVFGAWCLGIWFSVVVFVDLWRWFAVPLGLPMVGMAHAWGLRLLIGWTTYQYRDDDREMLTVVVWGVCIALTVWGLGALASWWMP